jgi:hypothetical protein
MTKIYVKDENGKYKLVEKERLSSNLDPSLGTNKGSVLCQLKHALKKRLLTMLFDGGLESITYGCLYR